MPTREKTFSPTQIDAVKQIVKSNRAAVRTRHAQNVTNPPRNFCKNEFWRSMVICLCTSQQKSGPKSPVWGFVQKNSFPLKLSECEAQKDLRKFAEEAIRRAGLRFSSRIAQQIDSNMAWLRNGGWGRAEQHFTKVRNSAQASIKSRILAERTAAQEFMGRKGGLKGIGPKQARNLWQNMHITQHEIPLDGRIAKWVKANLSPFEIEVKKLSSESYYAEKLSHIQALCEGAGVLPCDFDFAVFASADKADTN